MTVADWLRIEAMAKFVVAHSTVSVLRRLLPAAASVAAHRSLGRFTCFDHGALLVFPERVDYALAELARRGFRPTPLVPSTVVRARLAERHGLRPEDVPVMITQAGLPQGRSLELFLLPASERGAAAVMTDEREHQHQAHLAFRLREPREELLRLVVDALTGQGGGLEADGGGFNPRQGARGCTVLYFRGPGRLPAPYRWPRRLEIITDGRHSQVLAAHLRGTDTGR
ncbi:hypothetical protein [Actinomadura kijaniata]|uniref:hypothetical protein n=1 Tax=Actinomadura kijaniata TaxID=46161 RepID=UPI0012F70BA8|nr:hypothetical protein [Actinomadura kijaniata]